MTEADFQELSNSLFNKEDTAWPLERLSHERRFGNGSILVFTHGVCPGGTCETGGEDGSPLPRAGACSLCRYRLTGPAFLPGLVMNANVLIHEVRRTGLEIAALNAEIRKTEDEGRPSGPLRARVEAAYRKNEAAATEWAAEVQYAEGASKWLDKTQEGDIAPVVFGAEPPKHALVRVSHFELLQRLAEGGQTFSGTCPQAALAEHREYVNELLAASDMDPLLLKIKEPQRDRAAALLGRALTQMASAERLEDIRAGKGSLAEFPLFGQFFAAVRDGAAAGTLEWSAAEIESKANARRDE